MLLALWSRWSFIDTSLSLSLSETHTHTHTLPLGYVCCWLRDLVTWLNLSLEIRWFWTTYLQQALYSQSKSSSTGWMEIDEQDDVHVEIKADRGKRQWDGGLCMVWVWCMVWNLGGKLPNNIQKSYPATQYLHIIPYSQPVQLSLFLSLHFDWPWGLQEKLSTDFLQMTTHHHSSTSKLSGSSSMEISTTGLRNPLWLFKVF